MTHRTAAQKATIRLLATATACLALLAAPAAQALDLRSADIHNADDYPTVVAVKAMGAALEKASGGKHR
ncbi:MAG: 2,3-diketo-L-gulonate-binding periplasmic protein YiaO precursor, partial [Pseudomonadota bacterium]